jgi:phage shock protein PspC (stress-responsive transcriptional regulator)
MQKVITINLNGHAYQVEEGGYAMLVAYLDGAERQLKDNPDRAEIIADLEQAIAEKCARFIGARKTVVTSAEVQLIVKEMGPVDGAAGTMDDPGAAAGASTTGASGSSTKGGPAPKRLYLIREGAMLAGVCAGLAAYLNIDATIVRIIFIVLAVVTQGLFILVYFVLAVVIPSANTSEERAAARGEPFNAQELIDRAKTHYAEFKDGRGWNRRWRRRAAWRRAWRRPPAWDRWSAAAPAMPPAGYAARMLAGVVVPVLSIVSAALFWLSAYAVLALVATRDVFGVELPEDVPLWAAILVVVFLYQSIAWPLHASRRAAYQALGGPHHAMVAALDGLLSVGVGLLVVWFGYHYVPEVREFLRTLPDVWSSLRA